MVGKTTPPLALSPRPFCTPSLFFLPSIMNQQQPAANSQPGASLYMGQRLEMEYLCAGACQPRSYHVQQPILSNTDCGAKNEIRPREPIRCRECGHRIMYKKRTKRSKFFSAETNRRLLTPSSMHPEIPSGPIRSEIERTLPSLVLCDRAVLATDTSETETRCFPQNSSSPLSARFRGYAWSLG